MSQTFDDYKEKVESWLGFRLLFQSSRKFELDFLGRTG